MFFSFKKLFIEFCSQSETTWVGSSSLIGQPKFDAVALRFF